MATKENSKFDGKVEALWKYGALTIAGVLVISTTIFIFKTPTVQVPVSKGIVLYVNIGP